MKEELEKVEAELAGGWANAELTAVVGVGLLITEASGLSTKYKDYHFMKYFQVFFPFILIFLRLSPHLSFNLRNN